MLERHLENIIVVVLIYSYFCLTVWPLGHNDPGAISFFVVMQITLSFHSQGSKRGTKLIIMQLCCITAPLNSFHHGEHLTEHVLLTWRYYSPRNPRGTLNCGLMGVTVQRHMDDQMICNTDKE